MYPEKRYSNTLIIVTALVFILSSSNAFSAGINKWVDQDGKTHYGTQAPTGQAAQQIRKSASVAAPVRQDQPEIILYATSWCGYCKKARAYLRRNNIAYTEKDIEKDFRANREHKMLGGRGVPLLVRDGKETRAGFSEGGYDRFFKTQ